MHSASVRTAVIVKRGTLSKDAEGVFQIAHGASLDGQQRPSVERPLETRVRPGSDLGQTLSYLLFFVRFTSHLFSWMADPTPIPTGANLNRWILPVAVFGSSPTNSTHRGTLVFGETVADETAGAARRARADPAAASRSTTKAIGLHQPIVILMSDDPTFQHGVVA